MAYTPQSTRFFCCWTFSKGAFNFCLPYNCKNCISTLVLSCLEAPIMLSTTLISLEDSRVSVASKFVPELIFVLVLLFDCFSLGFKSSGLCIIGTTPLGLFYGPSNPLPRSPEYLRLLPIKRSPLKMWQSYWLEGVPPPLPLPNRNPWSRE